MTGYGEAAAGDGPRRATVTARSVNHRSLDVAVRVPPPLRRLEPELRAAVAAEVRRGRVEIGVELGPAPDAPVDVDGAAVEALLATVRRWRRRGVVDSPLGAGELLSAVGRHRPDSGAGAGAEEGSLAMDACRRALSSLAAERDREGRVLADALHGHLASLRARVRDLTARRGEVVGAMAGELERRVRELLADGDRLDPARLVQEVALLVERSDIEEELERLEGHLDGFAAAMAEEGAVGRRLVFLSQEILRELNTVGAKCRDLEMQRAVVEGKVLCEQLREQAQNVE